MSLETLSKTVIKVCLLGGSKSRHVDKISWSSTIIAPLEDLWVSLLRNGNHGHRKIKSLADPESFGSPRMLLGLEVTFLTPRHP